MVFFGFTTIWSLAIFPMSRSPFSLSATTDGRTRLPLSVGTTFGMRFRTDATRVLVVPRSIPTMRGFSDMGSSPRLYAGEAPPSNTPAGGFLDDRRAEVTMGRRRAPPPRCLRPPRVRRLRHHAPGCPLAPAGPGADGPG